MHTTWIEISEKSLRHNIKTYSEITKAKLFAPVIKSNAYGHGLELVAKICDTEPAVDMLCVISLSEALALREVGIKKPILVLGIYNAPLKQAILHDIQLLIYDLQDAQELSSHAQKIGMHAQVHIKIDTGLSRLGQQAEAAFTWIQQVYKLPNIQIHGICTHMAQAESDNPEYTQYQMARFQKLLMQLHENAISIPLVHSCASAALSAYPETHGTLARIGIGIYGLWPSPENKIITQQKFPNFNLQPVLSWKTKIIHIKEVGAGAFVGYDCTFQAQTQRRIATLPVGYWDGYDRKLSNTGHVLVHNIPAQVVGRIAMNLMMIDITNISAQVGDTVTLLGDQQQISAEDIARHCETINYEIVTRINPLLPRILVQ